MARDGIAVHGSTVARFAFAAGLVGLVAGGVKVLVSALND